VLQHYFQTDAVDFQKSYDETLAMAERLRPLVADVTALLGEHRRRGDNMLFEGAQGAMLDIDHGTYPYVTSSNTTAGGAATGTGLGPRYLDYVLGITKAYTTRVGGGPFPTELFDETGDYLAERGHEFGSTTGRRRRCGWFDAAALRRSVLNNSVSGLCVTKLDVLDGWTAFRMCVGYRCGLERLDCAPLGAEALAACEPIYEEMPGWQHRPLLGVRRYEDLPANALAYLRRIEELTERPIDMVSTGPDRADTIVLRDPFGG
jgi:adenylosuccinate synthase